MNEKQYKQFLREGCWLWVDFENSPSFESAWDLFCHSLRAGASKRQLRMLVRAMEKYASEDWHLPAVHELKEKYLG